MTTFRVGLGPDETTILLDLAAEHPAGRPLGELAETAGISKRFAAIAVSNLLAIGCVDRHDQGGFTATDGGLALAATAALA